MIPGPMDWIDTGATVSVLCNGALMHVLCNQDGL